MEQLTRDDVLNLAKAKKYGEIEQARLDGRLNVLMGGEPPPDPDKQLSAADVTRLYRARNYEAIEQARQDGRLDDVLRGDAPES